MKSKIYRARFKLDKAVEVDKAIKEAGFEDCSTFFRALFDQRQEIQAWREQATLEAARLVKRFKISQGMLEKAGREV